MLVRQLIQAKDTNNIKALWDDQIHTKTYMLMPSTQIEKSMQ